MIARIKIDYLIFCPSEKSLPCVTSRCFSTLLQLSGLRQKVRKGFRLTLHPGVDLVEDGCMLVCLHLLASSIGVNCLIPWGQLLEVGSIRLDHSVVDNHLPEVFIFRNLLFLIAFINPSKRLTTPQINGPKDPSNWSQLQTGQD